MKHKVTEQYARGKENLIAEFSELDDAKLFMQLRSANDEVESRILIYRLYENSRLLQELNKEKIRTLISKARYANADSDFYGIISATFKVVIKPIDGEEKLLAQFYDRNNAALFLVKKGENANALGANTISLYQNNTLLEQINKETLSKQADETDDGQGNAKKTQFRPSPLTTKLSAGPKSSFQDEGDDKSKE